MPSQTSSALPPPSFISVGRPRFSSSFDGLRLPGRFEDFDGPATMGPTPVFS
jgi:hypothetical protein